METAINLLIRPPRNEYLPSQLGPTRFTIAGKRYRRHDLEVRLPSPLPLLLSFSALSLTMYACACVCVCVCAWGPRDAAGEPAQPEAALQSLGARR
jgi:hypothetical protein